MFLPKKTGSDADFGSEIEKTGKILLYWKGISTERMVDAMAKMKVARTGWCLVARQHQQKLPEYGPLGTGCPAIERAVAALYKGQNEESFWALMNAINYALELTPGSWCRWKLRPTSWMGLPCGRSILSRRRKRKTCSPDPCVLQKAGVTCR